MEVNQDKFDSAIVSIKKEDELYTILFEKELKNIGSDAIWSRKPLKSLELPDSLEKLNGRSFNLGSYDNIKSLLLKENGFFIKGDILLAAIVPDNTEKVEIPEGVTTIGPWAFPKEIHSNKCQVVFPKSLLRVEDHAFDESECKIKFNKNLEYIGDYAFVYPSDTNIKIPDKVAHIGERAFNITERVKKINIGKGLKSIGRGAFASDLESVTACEGPYASEDGRCLVFDGVLLRVATKDPKRVYPRIVIPEGVHTIDTGAIPEPYAMPSFPKSLKTIRTGAMTFINKSELNLPDSVVEIEDGAFKCCRFDKITSKLASNDGMYLKCNSILILGSTKLEEAVIPKGIEIIGDYCFRQASLTSIKFNKELKKIGVEAFRFCRKLTGKVVIPEGVEIIDKLAFANTGIEELELPTTLKSMGWSAIDSSVKRLKVASPQFIKLPLIPKTVEVPESLLEQYKWAYSDEADRFRGF